MAIRRYAARVVLLDQAERVLLFNWANPTRGNKWWATPGGGVKAGEKSKVAALREVREETGIELADLEGPLWRTSHFFRSAADLVQQHETFFLARVAEASVTIEGFDRFEVAAFRGFRWWGLAELEATTEAIYPRGLAGLIRDVLRDGVPGKAVAIRG